MPIAPIAAAAAPIVGGLIGKAIGPGQGTTTPQLPQDLSQSRGDTIGLMRYLLGYGGGTPGTGQTSGPGQSALTPAFQRPGYQGSNPFGGQSDASGTGGLGGPTLQQPLGGGLQMGGSGGLNLGDARIPQMGGGPMPNPMSGLQGAGGGSSSNPLAGIPGAGMGGSAPGAAGQRVESVFGPTGIQATPLQRQATGGISQFLNQPSPETRTMDQLSPGLMSLFGGNGAGGGAFGQSQGALQGQLGGQSPLAGNLQSILQGLAGGANPLPGQAQGALTNQLGQNLLPGQLQQVLTQMGAGGGLPSQLQDLLTRGGGGADTSAIQNELKFNPNQQLLSALQPQFQQNLAMADQAGGRFGTANAYGRSQAVNDYNLMASQALQQDLARRAGLAGNLASATGASAANQNATRLGAGQLGQQGQLGALDALLRGGQASGQLTQGAAGLLGQAGQQGIGNQMGAATTLGNFAQQGLGNQQNVAQILNQLGGLQQQGQLGAGGLLGQLAGQSGQNDFSRLLGAYGVGTQGAQQNDVETQRNLGILLQQLGAMQGATLGAPVQTSPSGAQQGAQLGGSIGSLLALLGATGQLGGQQQQPSWAGLGGIAQ